MCYLIAGAGGNIAISAGGDGVIMVDSGAAAASDRVLAAVRQVVQTLRPAEVPDAASPFASPWQASHAFPEPMIRMIINTSSHPDHVGGNANIRMSPMFRLLGIQGSVPEPAGAGPRTGPTPDARVEGRGPARPDRYVLL